MQPQPGVESSSALSNARAALMQFIQCTKCGRTNAAEARFCDWCGTKVSAVGFSVIYFLSETNSLPKKVCSKEKP